MDKWHQEEFEEQKILEPDHIWNIKTRLETASDVTNNDPDTFVRESLDVDRSPRKSIAIGGKNHNGGKGDTDPVENAIREYCEEEGLEYEDFIEKLENLLESQEFPMLGLEDKCPSENNQAYSTLVEISDIAIESGEKMTILEKEHYRIPLGDRLTKRELEEDSDIALSQLYKKGYLGFKGAKTGLNNDWNLEEIYISQELAEHVFYVDERDWRDLSGKDRYVI